MLNSALHRCIAAGLAAVDRILGRAWLVAVAACAVLAATMVAALVEASYLGPRSRAAALPVATLPAAPKRRASPDARAFVERNMFCSTCAPGPGPTDSFDAQASLIAISQSAEPRATLRVIASEAQGSWGLGEVVPGLGRIERIGWVSIDVVDARGRRATLSLLPAAAGSAGTAIPAPAAASEWQGRIERIDDHTFAVERSLVRDLVTGAVRPGAMRILPVTDGGTLTGLRIFGVKDASLPAALGLHNGDVLSAINNKHIESVQTLLDVYAQLDQLSYVELAGKRGDKPLAISLRLK